MANINSYHAKGETVTITYGKAPERRDPTLAGSVNLVGPLASLRESALSIF